jgi:hypothetical protein
MPRAKLAPAVRATTAGAARRESTIIMDASLIGSDYKLVVRATSRERRSPIDRRRGVAEGNIVQSQKIYKVFVSSTYEDLREERAEVQKALLKLGCLPVGMEMFPAADDETWDFIKGQIDDSDYYVVLIAGRYGSLAPDGISFTEKEYDYARSRDKPSIAFVHASRNEIPYSKVENDATRIEKLDAFVKKVKSKPIRTFGNPHQLATEVVASFVDLMNRRPAVGFIRADQIVDYKRYSDVLEINNTLLKKLDDIDSTRQTAPFEGHEQAIPVTLEISGRPLDDDHLTPDERGSIKRTNLDVQTTLGQCLLDVASDVIMGKDEDTIQVKLGHQLGNRHRKSVTAACDRAGITGRLSGLQVSASTFALIRRKLYAPNLIDVTLEKRKSDTDGLHLFGQAVDCDAAIWRFTPEGRRQLLILDISK